MIEKLSNQIEIGMTDNFFPVKDISIEKRGRKRLLNREKYLEAVKKNHSTNDKLVARHLGKNRSRFIDLG